MKLALKKERQQKETTARKAAQGPVRRKDERQSEARHEAENHVQAGRAAPWQDILRPRAERGAAAKGAPAEVGAADGHPTLAPAKVPEAAKAPPPQAPAVPALPVAEKVAVAEKAPVAEVTPAEVQNSVAAGPILTRRAGTGEVPITPESAARLVALLGQSRGEPLPGAARERMDAAFGRDFSHVRAHTDSAAAVAARALDADAFTLGSHVFFREGRFAPGTAAGDRLIAHELAHVVQHDEGRIQTRVSPLGLTVTRPDDALEREAEAAVTEVMAGLGHESAAPAGTGEAAESAAGRPPAAPAPAAGGGEPTMLAASLLVVSRKATDTGKELLSKGYFQQAAAWGGFGGELSGALGSDASSLVSSMPVVKESLGPASPVTPATGVVAAPTGTVTLDEGAAGPDPGAPVFVDAGPGAAPRAPSAPRLAPGEGGDTRDMERQYASALQSVPTTADNVQTSPGPPPQLQLGGQSDPARAGAQSASATAQAGELGAQAAAAIDASPGPARVAPRSVGEEHAVPAQEGAAEAGEGLGEIPKMQEYAALGLPQEVQDQTDELGQAQIQASTEAARSALDQAQTDADTQREKAISDAGKENQEALDKANRDQDAAVEKARTDISRDQEETRKRQQAAVDDVGTKSEAEKVKLTGDVETRVLDDQKSIDGEFKGAEEKAKTKKAEAEREAETKKTEASSQTKDQSWWDRAVSAISAAFDALASLINTLFDALVAAVTALIDAAKKLATDLIDAARAWVVSQIQAFGDLLKTLVNALLADLFPELAAALNALIDTAVNLAIAAVNAAADWLKAKILALLDAIGGWLKGLLEALRAAINAALALAKAALTGDWEALGKLLLEAVLKLAGIPPADFYAFIDKAMGAIDTIIANPGGFVGNVINAVSKGFSSFSDNILAHLKEGFFAWLVGPLGELGITLPKQWDFVGIFGLVLDVLGLNKAGIRQIVVEELGETAAKIFDFVWKYVAALIDGGFEAVWEQLKSDLSGLWDTVVEGIKSYLIGTIVKQAVLKIASMFSPVGALLQAILTVWNVYNWLRTNVQRIWGIVTSIVNMIAAIAAGNIDPAAQAVESALASLIPIAISLLANLLGLGGITDKVKETLQGVRAYVKNAIKSLIKRVKALFKGGKDDDKKDERSEEEKKADLHKAILEGHALMAVKNASVASVEAGLPAIRAKYKLTALTLEPTDGGKYHVRGKVNPEEAGKDEELLQIIELPVPIPGGATKTVRAAKRGAVYIPVDKILIYGAGKVAFPEKPELDALRAERRQDQRAFSKEKAKQARIKELEGKEHNYERSQGNLKSLQAAGRGGSSFEDAFAILVQLFEDASAMGITMTPGTKVDIRSELPSPNGRLIIESKWKVQTRLDTGETIVRLDTLIYIG